MNEKMCTEMGNVLRKVDDTFKEYIGKDDFSTSEVKSIVKEKSHQIKKIIDYLKLFGEVNRELINDDLGKKAIKKKTRRYKISQQFVQGTESMERIL